MAMYEHILVGLDLSDDSDAVCSRATALANLSGARLTLVHVVEYVPVEPMGETLLPAVEIEQQLVDSARERLAALAQRHGLDETPREVRVGNIKSELMQAISDCSADLVVLGSHERHGVSIMVNYTEDTILHAAPCDVLAVRVR